jgi:hypothetical protein
VILLVHIVRAGGQIRYNHAPQFEQHGKRQARNGDGLDVGGRRISHPARHGQWRAVSLSHHIVALIVNLVPPDYWEGLSAQGMVRIVDCNFGRTLFMGSMSFSCSRP